MAKEIVVSKTGVLANTGDKYTNFVEMADKLSTDVKMEPRCKLCMHAIRAEAEAQYEKVGNYSAVHRWLKTQNVEISEPAVKHHLREHYGQDIRNLQIKEYTQDLKNNWMSVRVSEEERLSNYSAMIDQQIHQMIAMTDRSNIAEIRKTNESVAKLMDQSNKIQERLQNMRKEIEPIRILVEKFKNVVLVQMENVNSSEVKKVLVGLLQSLETEMDGIKLD